MKVIYAILLGLIQGLTEFLPISSSGHLMLFEHIFGINSGTLFFNVLLHFASLIAVLIIFWKDVINILKNPFGKDMRAIIIATILTVIIALFVKKVFNEYALMAFVGFGFLISSLIMLITSVLQNKVNKNISIVDNKNALLIGFIQGLAVFPGVSRSGSTICASLMCGIDREKSAKFSFLISVPVILGGMFFEIAEGVKYGFGPIKALPCIMGFIASFAVAILTIKLMMKIVKKGKWWYFSLYLFVLSIVVLLNQYVFCWF